MRLFDFIVRMVECGNLFSTIEGKLRENIYDVFLREKVKFHGDSLPDFNEIYKPISNTIIYKIFLVNNELNKSANLEKFKDVQCNILSTDHTFKAAANIGFMKDGRWVMQYDCLFILLNEKRMVKDYQLTFGRAFH